jgi:hypothetical protein
MGWHRRAAGPLIGGLITTRSAGGPRSVFQAGDRRLIVLLSRRVGRSAPGRPDAPFDAFGAVLSAVGMFFVVFGILQADNDLALMAVLLAAARVPALVLLLHPRPRAGGQGAAAVHGLFKNRTLEPRLVTQNIQWLLLMGVSFVVAVFLQTVRGYNAIETGVIFTAATLGVLVSSLAPSGSPSAAAADADHGRLRRHRAGIGCCSALVGPRRACRLRPGLLLIGLGSASCSPRRSTSCSRASPSGCRARSPGSRAASPTWAPRSAQPWRARSWSRTSGPGNTSYVVAMSVLGVLALAGLAIAARLPGKTEREPPLPELVGATGD